MSRLNKKGLTQDTIMILILSSITIVMVFTGVLFAYQELACYAGVNWSQQTSPTPQASSFLHTGIIFEETPRLVFTNQSQCIAEKTAEEYMLSECLTDCDAEVAAGLIFEAPCSENDEGVVTCETDDYCDSCATCCAEEAVSPSDINEYCAKKYIDGTVQYIELMGSVIYQGTTFSEVTVEVKEIVNEGTENETIRNIYRKISEGKLSLNDNFPFGFEIATKECNGSLLKIKAYGSSPNVNIMPAIYSKNLTYCLSPQPEDINIEMKSLSYNDTDTTNKSLDSVVTITGSAVKYLCPNATISFTGYDSIGNFIRLDQCEHFINTKANIWKNTHHFRTTLEVKNNLGYKVFGTDVNPDATTDGKDHPSSLQGEPVMVTLNFRESKLNLGFDHNMTNCEQIAITPSTENVSRTRYIDTDSFQYECYNPTISLTINDVDGNPIPNPANPVNYDINGDGSMTETDTCVRAGVITDTCTKAMFESSDCRCVQTDAIFILQKALDVDQKAFFDVYFQSVDPAWTELATLSKSLEEISAYFPVYQWIPQGGDVAVGTILWPDQTYHLQTPTTSKVVINSNNLELDNGTCPV